jgi:hypothetical protein
MGLLSKVVSKTSLDEMGEALVDRLIRLPKTQTLSDTALNMLKTYVSFKAGACLVKEHDECVSYSIFGFGKDKIHISSEIISQHKKVFYKIHETDINEFHNSGNKSASFWVFHLSNETLPKAILVLSNEEKFSYKTINLILEKAASVFLPSEKKYSALNEAENIITKYYESSGPFNCCVFNIITNEKTHDHIFQSIKNFGELLPLRGNTFMLLFPFSIDHELLLHHLDKRFHLNIIEQFSTDMPQKAFMCIQKYK